MLQNMISKDDVLASAEQLKELLPYNEENVQLIKKALILYRQDSVYRLQAVSPTEVTAYVQDVVPVRVTLNLFVIVKSGCSCPSGRICRHMLAVFLYVYAMFERVGTFTEYWLEREKLACRFSHDTSKSLITSFSIYDYTTLKPHFSSFSRDIIRHFFTMRYVSTFYVSAIFTVLTVLSHFLLFGQSRSLA